MDAQVAKTINQIFSAFSNFQSTISQIYDETTTLVNNESKLQGISSSCLNHANLQTILEGKLTFIILGQHYATQCKCLNWLVGDKVLPADNEAWLRKGNTVMVKHGVKPQLSFTLPGSYVLPVNDNHLAGIDLYKSLADYAEKCGYADLSDECDDIFLDMNIQGIKDADLELYLDSPILLGNVQIILKGLHDTVKEFFVSSVEDGEFHGSVPVVIYALNSDNLCPSDVNLLRKLKAVLVDCPVLFWLDTNTTSTPTPNDSTVQFNIGTTKLSQHVQCNPIHCREPSQGNQASHNTTVQKTFDNCACPTDANGSKNYERGPFKKLDNILQVSDSNVLQASNVNENQPAVLCVKSNQTCVKCCTSKITQLQYKLEEIGFHFDKKESSKTEGRTCGYEHDFDSQHQATSLLYTNKTSSEASLVCFVNGISQLHLIKAARLLNKFHKLVLDDMISQVFTLSRDVMITPKRMSYAQRQEEKLYNKLIQIATHKQTEIMQIIAAVKLEHADDILDMAEQFDIGGVENEAASVSDVSETTSDIQNMVLQHVKHAAAEKLTNTINVLRDNMTGTLSRCIECLELSDEHNNGVSDSSDDASTHLKMILNAAYNVEVSFRSSSSLLKLVIDKIQKMLRTLSWKEMPVMDAAWKRGIAEDVLNNLCEKRLSRNMCSQFQLQLHKSHESFLSAMHQLQTRHEGRLEREQEERHRAAKILAPRFAQLALRSRSLIDELLYGMPRTGREIGRGMYGVVFSCQPWAKALLKGKNCAIKSVVPHDEKHWNDLSLEFYYSMNLPPHPRIVQLYGSVVDESYGDGFEQPAVLLIMERMHQDLHSALKRGMHEQDRMRVALDVVEGIRYLHNQGLVHRDIKLKNVLLDQRNRAKISDLGFCKPSAMISGSIVGTPIHMPPELFTGQYDSSVDVYAFGILFWHLCAGTVRLPKKYRICTSKDHLWNAVRKGTRPEYLSCFRTDCWLLMKECWHEEPTLRPLLGIIQAKLHHVMKQVLIGPS